MPVWPAPANPPLAAAEEELLGTTMVLESRTFGVGVAGFSRLPGREFGSVEDAAFALGDRELTLFMVNKWGNLGLAATPPVADAAGLTAYWNEYGIGSLRAVEVDDTPAWAGRTPQPPEEFERYVIGASDGVRVAVSIRGPLPAATLSALPGTVPEGSAATFEVALDRAAWSARTVSLTVLEDGSVLSEAAPVSVAFAAGESRATVTLATVDDAAVTATLDARAAGVTDLTGLRYAVHLAALDLGDNALVDLRALADLAALTVLNLDRAGADPWSLARLTGLRRLSLRGNGLGDVEALRGLAGLRVLDIGANRVVDLAPLGGLSALEALRADGNAVRDASAVRAMERLRILDLDGDAAAGRLP